LKPNIGMLVATRNRRHCVDNLLNSLIKSDIDQIVISASGEDLSELVLKYSMELPIKYILGEAGQIRQKINGISVLSKDLDWVIFSDDDLEFNKLLLSDLRNVLRELPPDVLGIGLNLQITNLQHQRKMHQIVKKIFKLQIGKEGSVELNGECISYLYSKKPIQTLWLNGASVWRRETVEQYYSLFPDTKYAAYEDAFFSYTVSRNGKLLYLPNLKIKYSGYGVLTTMSSPIFLAVNYWKMLFVLHFKLSVIRSLVSIFGSILLFLFGKSATESFGTKLFTVTHLLKTLLAMTLRKNKLKFMLSVVTKELRVE
jgi:hypothetical protein